MDGASRGFDADQFWKEIWVQDVLIDKPVPHQSLTGIFSMENWLSKYANKNTEKLYHFFRKKSYVS